MTNDPIAAAAADIIKHVNDDHPDSLLDYLRAFTDVNNATGARMTGVDRTGFEIEAQTPDGLRPARIAWAAPLEKREQVREEMVRLAQEATAKLRPGTP